MQDLLKSELQVLRVLLIVGTILHQGIFIQCACPANIKCPYALYPDGITRKGLPRSWVFQIAPRIPGVSDNSTIKYCTPSYGMCVSNPCLNGATCMDSSFTTYKCQCAPGYEGDKCHVVVKLLIKNFDKGGVQIAKVSDLMFSTFFASHIVTIYSFDFDKWGHVLYWADTPHPETSPLVYDIRMSQGSDNWTTFSEREEDIVDIKVYEARRMLYWASNTLLKWSPLLSRHLDQVHPVRAVNMTKLPKFVYRFVIDQRRSYLYFISSSDIFRMTMDGRENTQITDLTSERAANIVSGFTLDEEGQRLFWSLHYDRHIFYHDLTRNVNDGSVLAEYEVRSISDVLFTAGWLIWLNHGNESVCVSRALRGQIKDCRPFEKHNFPIFSEYNSMALL